MITYAYLLVCRHS